jgi:membrane-bound lytic murein transglycosylase D
MARPSARLTAAALGCVLSCALRAEAADPHVPTKDDAPKTATVKPLPKGLARTRPGEHGTRRGAGGGSPATHEDRVSGAESADLRVLRQAESELFPQAAPRGTAESTLPELSLDTGGTQVLATGLPPSEPMTSPDGADAPEQPWLGPLELPDLPIRWDERVIRYLEFFQSDPVGHGTFANLYRHSGRWREMMRRIFRSRSLPEDLVWIAMIESGFDPTARSSAGAAGLWQFMPETAKLYGLTVDRWVDQRLNAATASEAAAALLEELHRKFGSWDLALAGYSMGYGGLAAIVRRYNTNDFWSLARTEGTLPWETTLYVPKVLAAAIVAHNLAAFGFTDLTTDSPIDTDEVDVPAGTPLTLVAQAAGSTLKDIETLNPELRAARTPPAAEGVTLYPVRVSHGRGASTTDALSRLRKDLPLLERYVMRFGETLEQVALARHTTTQHLIDLNAIAPSETIRGGTTILVPKLRGEGPPPSPSPEPTRPVVVVPADAFVYPDRDRVFYRVVAGDALAKIASALGASQDDLRRWNSLDPGARLQEGMTLQAFVLPGTDLSGVVVASERDVRVVPVGSDEFFATLEKEGGFTRTTVTARPGDTVESIGRRYGVSGRTMERVNRRSRSDSLSEGETVVVYVPLRGGKRPTAASTFTAGGAAAKAALPSLVDPATP